MLQFRLMKQGELKYISHFQVWLEFTFDFVLFLLCEDVGCYKYIDRFLIDISHSCKFFGVLHFVTYIQKQF